MPVFDADALETISTVSFYNTIACVTVLFYVSAARLKSTWPWLCLYVGSLGVVLIAQVTYRHVGPKSPLLDLVNLLTSVVSTWMIVQASLHLLNKSSHKIQIYLLSALGSQIVAVLIGHIVSASAPVVDVYKSIDACTCLFAAILYSVALLRKSDSRVISVIGAVGALLWGIGCLDFWVDPKAHPTAVGLERIALICGIAITSVASGLLAFRQPPDEMCQPTISAQA